MPGSVMPYVALINWLSSVNFPLAIVNIWNPASGNGLQQGELVLTGYVPEHELIQLYRLCKLFIFASLHEGFGLPVLEAMSCGAPAVGSNVTSIPEVIGNPEALFDPYSVSSIREKIAQCLTDDAFWRV